MRPNDGRVIPNFIMQALTNNNITVYGTGEQTCSFQYIDDLVNGMVQMMSTAGDVTGPVNIGNPECFTILELAKKIINLTKSSSCICFRELPQYDPRQRRPDIRVVKKCLTGNPKLKEGLIRIICYFNSQKLE